MAVSETKSEISFLNLNIRSILSNGKTGSRLNHLNNRCIHENYDIVSLTETHLNSGIHDNELHIDDYQLFRKDRNRSGGGVACYVKNNLSAKIVSNLMNENIEALWLQIFVKSENTNSIKSLVVGTCYRPPNQCLAPQNYFLEYLSGCLRILLKV